MHATIVVPLKVAGLWYGICVCVCRCSRVWWPCSQFCITAFVACTVWHVIPTSVAILKINTVYNCASEGEKEMPRCDSVQSPSLPPNLQVIQHDGTGEVPMSTFIHARAVEMTVVVLLCYSIYSCEGGPREGVASCHQLLWQAPA